MDEKLEQFNSVIETALSLTQKKRTYFCEYGYSNVKEVILGEQEELVRGPNWDKFYLENIIAWWKKKATKRYRENSRQKIGSEQRSNSGLMMMKFKLLDNGTQRLVKFNQFQQGGSK